MTAAPDQLACYQRDGFLILNDFVAASVCDDLRARAESLVSEFDPAGVVSIFSTHHGLLPHKSFANRSHRSRHAYTLHVIGGRSRYAPENWLQPPPSSTAHG